MPVLTASVSSMPTPWFITRHKPRKSRKSCQKKRIEGVLNNSGARRLMFTGDEKNASSEEIKMRGGRVRNEKAAGMKSSERRFGSISCAPRDRLVRGSALDTWQKDSAWSRQRHSPDTTSRSFFQRRL